MVFFQSCARRELGVHFPHDLIRLGAQTYAGPRATFLESRANNLMLWALDFI